MSPSQVTLQSDETVTLGPIEVSTVDQYGNQVLQYDNGKHVVAALLTSKTENYTLQVVLRRIFGLRPVVPVVPAPLGLCLSGRGAEGGFEEFLQKRLLVAGLQHDSGSYNPVGRRLVTEGSG